MDSLNVRAKIARCRALEKFICNANENYTHYICVSKCNRAFRPEDRGLNEAGEERGVTEEKRDAQPPRIRDGCRTLFFLVNIGRAVNFVIGIT